MISLSLLTCLKGRERSGLAALGRGLAILAARAAGAGETRDSEM